MVPTGGRPRASKGQFNLGIFYEHGKGVVQSYEEAVKWYRRAADQGFAMGQTNLGVRFHFGKGVAQNAKEAVKWYRLAADKGHAQAEHNLGAMFIDVRVAMCKIGAGVERDQSS